MRDVVVVTGAASGIGRAVAERLTANGALVVAVDRDVPVAGTHAAAIVGDVRDPATHRSAVAQVGELGATLTGWVNVAGVTLVRPLTDATPEFVENLVAINQLGSYWGCVEAVRAFRAQGSAGSIVNISSVHGGFAHPGHSVYEMTKAAVEALARSVAVEYGEYGIRANAVAPGAVDTPALRASAEPHDESGRLASLAAQAPLGRLAAGDDVATVVAFLLSDAAAFVSGQTIRVDGGWTSQLMRDQGGGRP